MPVTIKTADHQAREYWSTASENMAAVKSSDQLLTCLFPVLPRGRREQYGTAGPCKRTIHHSSFQFGENPIYSASNGFVESCIQAYNQHHHLIIRPDDVWTAIISQYSCYVNKHAEELRHLFVEHEGKVELEVEIGGFMETADFNFISKLFAQLIHENVSDAELRDWILPTFSTTTEKDRAVGAIMMMGTLQIYFNYTLTFACGIPTVTLMGTKEDYEDILKRIEKLSTFGEEPTTSKSLLKPIITRFIRSFDEPNAPEVIDFWRKIAAEEALGSGAPYIAGWLTAFCFWNKEGNVQERPEWGGPLPHGCSLDGIKYQQVYTNAIPAGFTTCPLRVNDNGHEYMTKVIAGSVAIEVTSSGRKALKPPPKDINYGRGPHEDIRCLFDGTDASEETWRELQVPPSEDDDRNDPSPAQNIAHTPQNGTDEFKPEVADGSSPSQEKDVTSDNEVYTALDTIQPLSGWWMFEEEPVEETEEPPWKQYVAKSPKSSRCCVIL